MAGRRVGVGERAKPEARIGIVAHRQAVQRQAVAVEDCGEGIGCLAGEVVGIVQIGGGQPVDTGGASDKLLDIWGPRQAELEGV